jgi:uncharacterized membrane protein YhhN
MHSLIIILSAICLLAGLLCFEKKGLRYGMLPTKTALSSLFIVTAWVQPHRVESYALLVMIGLICCLAGDVLLALPQDRMFTAGLFSFLSGHVFYGVSFLLMADLNRITLIAGIATLMAGIAVYAWLKPHLGRMKIPVIAYILVISCMVCSAGSMLGTARLTAAGRLMVFTGAVSFYLSDILVARDRFLKNSFINRVIGLPLYYLGQFLIAFSVGAVM